MGKIVRTQYLLRPWRLAAGLLLLAAFILGVMPGPGVPSASAEDPFQPTPCRAQVWNKGSAAFTALPGAKAHFGEYAGGLYRIEIPDNWNGELVLYAHGYAGEGDTVNMGTISAPWREHMIKNGFAWAASSYRCNSYVPGIGLQDTLLLTGIFHELNGGKAPERTYLTGVSMGGHATLLGMQEFPTAFAGGLAICPAGPTLFDYFAANGAAAEVVTGLKFGGGQASSATLATMNEIFGTPPAYTAKGMAMASIMINSTGGPRPFVLEGLTNYFQRTISGSKLAGEPGLLAAAATNEGWTYGIGAGHGLTADQVNSQARRLAADTTYRGADSPYAELHPFDGEIERPLLTMHTTGDMFVPIFLQRDLYKAVTAAGNGDLLVQRIYRDANHCGFSSTELIKSFDDMVAWARGGTKPEGDDINAPLLNAGLKFTNPLRPNDPGTLEAGKNPPLPPATGDSAPAGDASPLADAAAPAALVATLVVVGILFERRRRARG